MNFLAVSVKQVLSELATSSNGLSSDEALRRQRQFGPNVLQLQRTGSVLQDIIEPFKSAFVIILILAAGISLILGKQLDAIVIMAVVVVNAIIFYIQKLTAHHALKALTRKDSRMVKAMRDGKAIMVAVESLVPGDIVLLTEGLKVPADGRLIEQNSLMVDESMLTGESLPVDKNIEVLPANTLMYDQVNMVFSGSLIVAGTGMYAVTATANTTEMARIAMLSRPVAEVSPLQHKIDSMTGRIVVFAAVAATAAFALGIYRGNDAAEMLRFALSMMVSAVPEGLPVALTLVLILGIKRLAGKNVLVRNLTAVETLGQTTMIATDKTGTITRNELSVAHIWRPEAAATGDFEKSIFLSLAGKHHHTDDPLENILASQYKLKTPRGWKYEQFIPFNQAMRVSGSVWKTTDGHAYFLKGAPESIIAGADLTKLQRKEAEYSVAQLSSQGYRLIAFATVTESILPSKNLTELPAGLQLVGIVAFADQLRPEIKDAIAATHQAGIKVIMVTGDHIETARAFGKQSGIITRADQSAEGAELEQRTPTQIRHLLRSVRVFGRVLPEHKYRILQAVEKTEITAMTGDGVNDVPAIVKANVGIAMGNGTDAAKEASDVILVDSNYASIIRAVEEGRTTLANVRKMVFYLFATNLGEVSTMLGALILGLPLPITALQILWINMVTDGFTVIPLGLESAEGDQMKKSPENIHASLLRRSMLLRVAFTAALMAVVTLTVFALYLPSGLAMAQTMAFATLVVIQLANALNARSEHASFVTGFKRPNYKLWAAIAASLVLQVMVFWGPLQGVFGVVPMGIQDLYILGLTVIIVLIAGDISKKIFK